MRSDEICLQDFSHLKYAEFLLFLNKMVTVYCCLIICIRILNLAFSNLESSYTASQNFTMLSIWHLKCPLTSSFYSSIRTNIYAVPHHSTFI